MHKFIFIANDPGGYDAVYPVAMNLSHQHDTEVIILLTGQASKMQPIFKMDNKDILSCLEKFIASKEKFVLVTGTSWGATIELDAIRMCKENGIPTISILDYWSNYKERFRYGDDFVIPDYYFVMDELALAEAIESGIDEKIIRVVGNPGLDQYLNNKSKKKLLFISQPLSILYEGEKNYGYTEFDVFSDILKAANELGIEAFIKFHPKENHKMIDLYGHCCVKGDLRDIASEYDVLIGMTTMGLLQLSLMGYSVLSYQPNLNKEDICITNKLGITKGVYDYDDLVIRIKRIIGAVESNRLPFWYDGKSTERCQEEILKISENI